MKVIIAGDYCPQYRVANILKNGDYDFVLNQVKPIVEQADFSIVNLECPVSDTSMLPIKKCGPNLRCAGDGVEALKWTGFNCVTLANNHFLDYGDDGVRRTIEECRKYGLEVVGGGTNNKDASTILYQEINAITIAIINCCEHEFSQSTGENSGSNPLNPIQQYYAVQEAKRKADYVIIIVHGGHEHYQLPSPRMQELYRFFVDIGADVVVNHHQHCYSGYEVYKEKPIFYGLGNFCFDNENKRKDKWNEGFILELNVEHDKKIDFNLIPYSQCDESPNVVLMEGDNRERFFRKVKELNAIIVNNAELEKNFLLFCESRKDDLLISLMPYKTCLFKALGYRHLIPTFVNENKALQLYNYIACESHRDTLLQYLKKLYDKED